MLKYDIALLTPGSQARRDPRRGTLATYGSDYAASELGRKDH
jgi:hypothetical protein